ncbi:asparagine synthetase B family protein [Massilia litorea]|uniref:asparagine synthase (glutamine-hydrolyzing) n=1 Tax=Massilia litorea TaxID=2769491 RepID=A0A7L9U7W5_9BURK|nr:hypothetical protein [Massilia litorea]QOL50947.1 hypothetical protein LPB04_06580 [Massilia litorea]
MQIDLTLLAQNFANVEFFLACIFPSEAVELQGSSTDLLTVSSSCFWAVSSRAPSTNTGLVHKVGENLVVFRGYEVSSEIHSYSPPEDLSSIAADDLQNGVFSFLRFDTASQSATIKCDAFGMSPLFYRKNNGSWYVASHPGLLYLDGDVPDLTSWASLMQNGYVLGDRSFYHDIKRFAAGAEMQITAEHCDIRQWFDFAKLPAGQQAVDDDAVDVIETAFRASMERCMKLKVGEVTLPFSSGFDSRRFFALLVKKNIGFKAVTCQSYNRKQGRDYDIDSVYAPKIAAAFGVDCEVVPASSPDQLTKDALKRQHLIGTETFMHSWAVPLMQWLAGRPPSLILDGLAGDVLGNSSFDIEGFDSRANDSTSAIVEKAVKEGTLSQLSARVNSADSYRQKYREYVNKFLPNTNQSQLAFLQGRTRRCIAPSITMMHPPGHVVVFPYCDLEFAFAALSYDPEQKYKRYLQRECLQRFYPEFYDFPSSRCLPADHPPVDESISEARSQVEKKYIYGDSSVIRSAFKYVSFSNKVLLFASQFAPALRQRRAWLFGPLLMIVRTYKKAPVYIKHGPKSRQAPVAGTADSEVVDVMDAELA